VAMAFLVSAVKEDTRNSLGALGILVVSYPTFMLMRRHQSRVERIERSASEALTPDR